MEGFIHRREEGDDSDVEIPTAPSSAVSEPAVQSAEVSAKSPEETSSRGESDEPPRKRHCEDLRIKPYRGLAKQELTSWLIQYESMAASRGWKEEGMRDRLPYYLAGDAANWYYSRSQSTNELLDGSDLERSEVPWAKLTWKQAKEELMDAFLPADYEVHLREKLDAPQKEGENVITFFHRKVYLSKQLGCSSTEAIRAICKTLRSEYRQLLGTEPIARTGDLLKRLKQADLTLADNRRVQDSAREISKLRELVAKLKAKHQGKGKKNSQGKHGGQSSSLRCFNCDKKGHKARDCRSAKKTGEGASSKFAKKQGSSGNKFHKKSENKDNDKKKESVYKVELKQYSGLVEKVILDEKEVSGLIDTGASMTCMKESIFRELFPQNSLHDASHVDLSTAKGDNLEICGLAQMKVRLHGQSSELNAHIVVAVVREMSEECILGRDFLHETNYLATLGNRMGKELERSEQKALNIEIQESPVDDDEQAVEWCNKTVTQKPITHLFIEKAKEVELKRGTVKVSMELRPEEHTSLLEVLRQYDKNFAFHGEIGDCAVMSHKIEVTEDRTIHSAPYRQSFNLRETVAKQIEEWLELGVIRPSRSAWSSPVVVVPKKDGGSRLCIDYRKVNAITKRDVYPLPNFEDLFAALNGAKYFSSLDLNQGYLQVRMDSESIPKTAFVTQEGLYEFLRMPFGLTNAPATFQRCMDSVLGGLKWKKCLVYLDDVIVFGKNLKEHNRNLMEVMERLTEAQMTIKPSKCAFAMAELKFLGHIISREGIHMDPAKVSAIKCLPKPTNATEVRSFIGAASYYRRFVDNFGKLAEPITRLTKQKAEFKWGDEQEKAFNLLKEKLSTEPVLCHYDPNLPMELRTDACKMGIGAILLHVYPDKSKRVISYASRQLVKREQNYHTTEQECLAIVWAIDKLKAYLQGRKFTVVTDHAALTWLQTKQSTSARLLRWALKLQAYDYKVEYKSGKLHQDADLLSRNAQSINVIRYGQRGQAPNRDEPAEEQDSDANIPSTDGPEISLERFREGQRNDEFCQQVLDRREFEKFQLLDGILREIPLDPQSNPGRIVVPVDMLYDVLYYLHDDPLSAHCGYRKTLWRFRLKYYIKNGAKRVKHYVQSCHKCQTRKESGNKKIGFLQPIPLATKPFQKIGIDTLGPFRKSKSGNYKIIVITDYFTKWAIARAVPSETSAEVASILAEEVFCKHGAPEVILSDRGKIFQTKLVEDLYRTFAVRHVKTSAYHPQTNGLTERANRTLAVMLSMYVNRYHNDWDSYLPYVVFAYNTVVQDSTGFSPFCLLYGYDASLPSDVEQSDEVEPGSRFERLQEARQWATLTNEAAQGHQKKYYDKNRRKPPQYPNGTKVLVYRPRGYTGQTTKLRHAWEGPCSIIDKSSDLLYLVRRDKPTPRRPREEWVNVARIKAYTVRQEPTCI